MCYGNSWEQGFLRVGYRIDVVGGNGVQVIDSKNGGLCIRRQGVSNVSISHLLRLHISLPGSACTCLVLPLLRPIIQVSWPKCWVWRIVICHLRMDGAGQQVPAVPEVNARAKTKQEAKSILNSRHFFQAKEKIKAKWINSQNLIGKTQGVVIKNTIKAA